MNKAGRVYGASKRRVGKQRQRPEEDWEKHLHDEEWDWWEDQPEGSWWANHKWWDWSEEVGQPQEVEEPKQKQLTTPYSLEKEVPFKEPKLLKFQPWWVAQGQGIEPAHSRG